ncbi:MAG: molybdenum cofactor guanylyltransferase [Chloroflexota bacterium]
MSARPAAPGDLAPLANVTGIVLAGGRSSRFGSDKLVAELDGRPLLHHAIEALAAVTERIVVVAAPDANPNLPGGLDARVRIVHDPEPFGGPLAGLAAGLAAVETATALVVGGDMPRMVPAVLRRLATTTGPTRPAVHLEIPGRLHPLPMAVDVEAAGQSAVVVLGRGDRALRELLAELHAVAIPALVWLVLDPRAATIVDVDRPADLGSARRPGT